MKPNMINNETNSIIGQRLRDIAIMLHYLYSLILKWNEIKFENIELMDIEIAL